MKVPKEYRGLYEQATAQGWTVTMTGSGHLMWTSDTGRSVFTPSSPGDNWGGQVRVIAKLRRNGLRVDGRGRPLKAAAR